MALTASTIRRRSPIEYASALAITVIAAVAIAAVALQGADRSGSSDASTTSGTPQLTHYEAGAPMYVMYIVDSQEKADGITKSEQEMLMAYMNSYHQPSNRTSAVLVAKTAEEGNQAERLANLAAQEMVVSGTVFELVDLRGR